MIKNKKTGIELLAIQKSLSVYRQTTGNKQEIQRPSRPDVKQGSFYDDIWCLVHIKEEKEKCLWTMSGLTLQLL